MLEQFRIVLSHAQFLLATMSPFSRHRETIGTIFLAIMVSNEQWLPAMMPT